MFRAARDTQLALGVRRQRRSCASTQDDFDGCGTRVRATEAPSASTDTAPSPATSRMRTATSRRKQHDP